MTSFEVRHDDCVFDWRELAPYQGPPTQGAPQLTAEEMALQQLIRQAERDENEIRAVYGLPALSERGLDEWIDWTAARGALA